ncbi:MAG: class I SAM-dependent methyltransferase [Thermoplasmata archaeon]|nr:MAG: class I SAM-dependent methyltransferase [Thermoplasmata archaeon]
MVGKKHNGSTDLVDEIRDHVKLTFEQIAGEFDSTRYKPWPETVEFLKTVPPGSTILDLGVGNGRNAVHAVKNNQNVVGVDIAGNMLALARSKFINIPGEKTLGSAEFVQADFEKLPIKPDTFDAVICVASLHHIPSGEGRLQVVSELHRVLKPGGTALVSVWDLDQPRFKQELMRQLYCVCRQAPQPDRTENDPVSKSHPRPYEFGDVWVPWQSKDGQTYYRFYHLFYHNELESLMEKGGFKINKYFRRADNHNVVVSK